MLIDDRGRLFGRWNLIDAFLVFVACCLIPLAYAAYALFRTPMPVIESITPTQLVEGQSSLVTLTGRDFRPYLRVRIGTVEGGVLFEDPSRAEVRLPQGLPAGTYDLAVYDEARELLRMPQVITSGPAIVAPRPTKQATVRLVAELYEGIVATLKARNHQPLLRVTTHETRQGRTRVELVLRLTVEQRTNGEWWAETQQVRVGEWFKYADAEIAILGTVVGVEGLED